MDLRQSKIGKTTTEQNPYIHSLLRRVCRESFLLETRSQGMGEELRLLPFYDEDALYPLHILGHLLSYRGQGTRGTGERLYDDFVASVSTNS